MRVTPVNDEQRGTRDQLVMENVGLVKLLAHRLARRLPPQVEVSELMSIGTLGLIDAAGQVLKSGNFQKIAIADPALAPYGTAAIQTMRKLGVYDRLRPKIVMGTSITQAFQFVDSGAAEVGFVAASQVVNVAGGSRWLVPASNHSPINQQAVLLYTGQTNPAAKAFLDFLKAPPAVAIIRRYGYEAR